VESQISLDSWRWLVSDDAARWLKLASDEQAPAPAAAREMRRHLDAERTRLVFEQVELRRRAAKKFTRAAEMCFTRRALEQATDERVARYKAQKISTPLLVDACCGIGGDLLSLSSRANKVTAVDIDPVMTLLAAENTRIHGIQHIDFQTRDVASLNDLSNSLIHIDPDRRSLGRRVSNIDGYEPGPSAIRRLTLAARGAAIKLAPAAEVPDEWAAAGQREWIQCAGECRQQVLWLGELASVGGLRVATVVNNNTGECADRIEGFARLPPQSAPGPARYIYDPASAVLAAGLLDDLAHKLGLLRAAVQCSYLTSDNLVRSALVAAFLVQDVIPFDIKRLKRYVREHQLGRLEIKKRGVDVQPEKILRTLRVDGDQSATILIARLNKRVMAIVGQRQESI